VRVAVLGLSLIFVEEVVLLLFVIPSCPDLPGISGFVGESDPAFVPPKSFFPGLGVVNEGDVDGEPVALQFLEDIPPLDAFENGASRLWYCWRKSGVLLLSAKHKKFGDTFKCKVSY